MGIKLELILILILILFSLENIVFYILIRHKNKRIIVEKAPEVNETYQDSTTEYISEIIEESNIQESKTDSYLIKETNFESNFDSNFETNREINEETQKEKINEKNEEVSNEINEEFIEK